MRGALIVLVVAAASAAAVAAPKKARKSDEVSDKAAKGDAAKADAPKGDAVKLTAPKPRKPGPEDAKAIAVLERVVAGPDATARKAAIAELGELAPRAVEAIGEWLVRPHTADGEARRAVLEAIHASVPDKTGKFSQPPRQTGKQQKADDEIDWQVELLALQAAAVPDAPPAAIGEVIADDAAIRALAATSDIRAAELIFNAAFVDETMMYRDECGRYLRRMEPASIPALTVESMSRNYDRRRYATWQLERLDRQEPSKVLDSVLGDEALTIAILDVFRRTHHREAVHAVWKRVTADAPRVRAAARAAWMSYITGPPPPPAPVAKLNLPGGKKTKKPKPLWLTYRELADNELRKAANELLGENYPPIEDPALDDIDRPEKKPFRIDLEKVTQRLFDYFDAERAKKDAAQWAEAKQKADAGDLAGAIQLTDRMLVTNPDRSERAELAKLYFAWAKQLESQRSWGDAAAAYSKAHGLDPQSAFANDALAAYHFTLGKSLEGTGKDGGPAYRRAVALKPDYAPAQTAVKEVARAAQPVWMLYAAGVAVLAAMLLFGAAVIRRRA